MLENAVSSTSFGAVAGISIAVAVLVAILLLGGLLIVRLGFFAKRDMDQIGPLAPSDKGYLDRKLSMLRAHSRDVFEDQREYGESETEDEFRGRPAGDEKDYKPQGGPAA